MAQQSPAAALCKTPESITEATSVFAGVAREGGDSKLYGVMARYWLEPYGTPKVYQKPQHAAWLTEQVAGQKTESAHGLIIAYRKAGENTPGEGHVVAAKWSGAGDKRTCYFFDPNFGEYAIHPRMEGRFFAMYFDRVKAEFKALDNWLLFTPVNPA